MARAVDQAASGTPGRERTERTFRSDRIRGACNGVLETCLWTFSLLIVIREFHAPGVIKSIIVASHPLGLLLTPITLFWISRRAWPASLAVSSNYAFASVALVVAALADSLWMFIVSNLVAAVILAQQMPLMVHIYTENYSSSRRGRLLATSVVLSVIAAMAFALGGGALLDRNLSDYRWLYGIAAGAAVTACLAVRRIPSSPLSPHGGRNPLANLSLAWKDRIFGAMLGTWMLMGLGNLITWALRIEYMANPVYGINATNSQIALATVVIPSLVRVFATHLWGYAFDRYDFFLVRIALNICGLTSIILFFTTKELPVLYLSGGIFGFGLAGANIAWSLWVTKFAPPQRAPDYMSVHTFATGFRGVMAPFIGFAAIVALSPFTTAMIAAVMIATATVLLVPLRIWAQRVARPAPPEPVA